MKPSLGWTMLSREEMRQAERLASGDQDTRDEIGFLLIHQGFADRFCPGTSVLHTRVRYVLFVPWLFLQAAKIKHRGRDLDTTIRRQLIQLAIRLSRENAMTSSVETSSVRTVTMFSRCDTLAFLQCRRGGTDCLRPGAARRWDRAPTDHRRRPCRVQ